MSKESKSKFKQEKREHKMSAKSEKLKFKSARKAEKLAAKLARKEQRVVVRYRSRLPRDKAIELMEEIVAGLKAGTISVEQDDQQLTIHPPEVVDLRVQTRQTWKNEDVSIRVRWPRSGASDDSPSIKVTSADPPSADS